MIVATLDGREGETVGESNRSGGVERTFRVSISASVAAAVAAAVAVAVRGLVHAPLVRRALVPSSSLVVRVCARVATRHEGSRGAAESPEARRGAARRPKTSRLRISPALAPSLRSRSCARSYAHVRARVVPVPVRVCASECTSAARVLARERAAEEGGTSANGSSQDYSKPRKYEHCCPITSRRVH